MSKPFKLPAFFDSKVKKTEMKEEEKTRQRIRVKEHVHGNWPTLIFIPITFNVPEDFTIAPNYEAINPIIPKGPAYHLSLTRTLYVKDHQKDLFRLKIEAALRKSLQEDPLPKTAKCEKFCTYFNDEKTRSFLAVDVENLDSILKLINAIDSVLKSFNLPVYYKSPKLHFSLFWRQGGDETEILDYKECEGTVKLEEIIIKCGNKISRIEL